MDYFLTEREKRDTEGLYAKAQRAKIREFMGISDPGEIPTNPELIIFTEKESVEEGPNELLLI